MAVAAVSVLAEQRSRPHRTPWYPWALTALAAGSSILLNLGHSYIPLDPPPRWLIAAVYGVPPICAPFAWHLFLLRIAHRRQPTRHARQDTSGSPEPVRPRVEQDAAVQTPAGLRAGQDTRAPTPVLSRTSQTGEPPRAIVRGLLAYAPQDAPVSWQDVPARTGVSRSRSYALLREERARLARANGHPPATGQESP